MKQVKPRQYSSSFAKEQRIMNQAYKMGYKSRKEVAKVLGQRFYLDAVLDVSGGTQHQLISLLQEARDGN